MIKRNLLVMGLAVLLSACGFQLRGTGTNELSLKGLRRNRHPAAPDPGEQRRARVQRCDLQTDPDG